MSSFPPVAAEPQSGYGPSLELGLDLFFARLARARDRALLADYGGTLAPLAAEGHAALPYPGVFEELRGLLERWRRAVASRAAFRDRAVRRAR